MVLIAWIGLIGIKGLFQPSDSVCNFLSLMLELSIPNQPVIPLRCFITKWIRTDKSIKPGHWVHYVYMIYPLRICLGFRLKSCSSCISFQADKSFWSCATQCFRPGTCCKQALSLHFSKSQIPKFHTLNILQKVHLSQFNGTHCPVFEHSFFFCPYNS